jgi:hypothetical protein
MSFETDTLCMVMPLDPYEGGDRYNEPMDEDAWSSVIENIYKITWAGRTTSTPPDGELSGEVSSLMTQILRMPWRGGRT